MTKERAALDLSMGILIFATILYVFSFLLTSTTPGALPAYNATFVNATAPDTCTMGLVVIDGALGCLFNLLLYVVNTIINLGIFMYQILLWVFAVAYTVFLFGWIWTGSLAFPYPLNFIFGIPLTAMGLFILIEMVGRVLALLPFWRGGK